MKSHDPNRNHWGERLLASFAVIATIASGAFAWRLVTATPEPVVAAPIPAPTAAPTSVSTPFDLTVEGVERSVADRIVPWESQAINVITGAEIGETDFTTDIAFLNQITKRVPAPWKLIPTNRTSVSTPGGDVPLSWAESTQPFRDRLIISSDGDRIGEIWIFAGISPSGLGYVSDADQRWNPNTPSHLATPGAAMVTSIDTPGPYDPDPGPNGKLWYVSVTDRASAVIAIGDSYSQRDIVAVLLEWRSSFD